MSTTFLRAVIRRLDLIATILMIGASVSIIAGRLRLPDPLQPESSTSAAYQPGEAFQPLLPPNSGTKPTLVLWLHSKCRYCEESIDFYKRIAGGSAKPRLILMGRESTRVLADYASRHKLNVDHVMHVVRNDVRLTGTPTLVLVDASGVVRRVWMGRLSLREELSVLETVATFTKVD